MSQRACVRVCIVVGRWRVCCMVIADCAHAVEEAAQHGDARRYGQVGEQSDAARCEQHRQIVSVTLMMMMMSVRARV
jgi:hypothetical protein